MTIAHQASYGTPAYDVVKNLEATLEAKRAVRAGQISEQARLERNIAYSNRQIEDIEAAIAKLKLPETA